MATRRLLPLTAPGANPLTQVEGTLRGGQFGGRLFEFDTGERPELFEYQPGGFGIGSFRQLQQGFTDEELAQKYGANDIFQLPVSGRELVQRATIQTGPTEQITRPGFTGRAFQRPEEVGYSEKVFREGEAAPEGGRFLSPEEVSRFQDEAQARSQQLQATGQVQEAGRQLQPQERPNLVIRAGDRGDQLFGVFGGVGRDRVLRPIDQNYGIEPLSVPKLEDLRIPEVAEERFPEARGALGGIRDIPPQNAPGLSQERQLVPQPSQAPSVRPVAPGGLEGGLQGGSLGENLYSQTLAELKQAQSGVQGLYEKRARLLEQRPSAVQRLQEFRTQQGIPQLQQGILEAAKQQGLLEAGAEAAPEQVKEATQAFFVSAPKLQQLTNLRLGEFAKALNAVNRYMNVLNTSLGFQSDAVKEFLNASQLDQAAALEAVDTRIKAGEDAQTAAEKVFDILGNLAGQQRQERQLQLQEQAAGREQQTFSTKRAQESLSLLSSGGSAALESLDAFQRSEFEGQLNLPRGGFGAVISGVKAIEHEAMLKNLPKPEIRQQADGSLVAITQNPSSPTGFDVRTLTTGRLTTARGGGIGRQAALGVLSSRAKAVYDNPGLLHNYTPTEKGKILDELSKAGLDLNNFALEKIGGTQRESIAQYDTLLREAASAATLLEGGLNVGPIASRLKAGVASLGGAQEFTTYRSVIDNLSSILLRLRSGAAVTPQEYERIRGFIPLKTDDENTAKTKINRFREETATAQQGYVQRATQTSQQIVGSVQDKSIEGLRQKYGY